VVRVRERTGLIGCGGTRAGGRAARALGVIAMAGVSLALLPVASAAASPFTWTGASSEAKWSAAKNWEGEVAPEVAPSDLQPVALDFPRLASCSGTTCYESKNNLSALNVESIGLDDGDDYELSGEEIKLGSGGLTASPASGSSGSDGDTLELPIALTAKQTWSIAGRSGGALGENGLALEGGLTGSTSALTFEISNEAVAVLANNTEVGPLAIDGANASKAGILNGFVEMFGAELDSSDGNPVSLNHIFVVGDGAFGPLSTDEAELIVEDRIATASATFDAASDVGFEIYDAGSTAGTDYSQLSSTGAVDLAGSKLLVHVPQPLKKKESEPEPPCPTLVPGQTYTFVSTTGALSGSFANALENEPEMSISFAKTCSQNSQKMRIRYSRTGATHTVTGIVEAAAKEQQEAKEAKEKQERETHEQEAKEKAEFLKKFGEENAERVANEVAGREAAAKRQQEEASAAAAKKHQEEEAAINHKHEEEAAAKKKAEEETAATGSVLLNGSSITVQSGGEAVVKLACAGTTTCAGKLTLTVKGITKKGKKAKMETIGTAAFSIPPNETTTIKLMLNAAGKALLGSDHGHLDATLSILKSSPAPSQTHTNSVHLVQQKAHGKAKK